jgi:F0F1-type ATP synthase membrane subunit c/vacuolar-type H+-ATPase subunit K
MESTVDLKREHQITVIIASAMIAALFTYALVVEAIKYLYQPFAGFAPQSPGQTREGLFAGALLMLVAIRIIRNMVLKKTPNDTVKTLVTKLKTATIITSALCEVPALLGMVLFMMGGQSKDFYVLLLYSLTLMVLYFPKYNHLQAWVGRAARFY